MCATQIMETSQHGQMKFQQNKAVITYKHQMKLFFSLLAWFSDRDAGRTKNNLWLLRGININNLQFLPLSIFSRKRHHGNINNTRYILSGFLVISFCGLSTVLAVYIKLPPLYNLFCIHLSDHHDNTLKSISLKPLWMEQTSLAEENSSSFFGFLVLFLLYGFWEHTDP